MANVDWNYIAGRLANTFYKTSDLKNIKRNAFAAYPKELSDYAPSSEKEKRYRTIYNFVITVSKIPGLTDDSKVQIIYKLIGMLNEPTNVSFEKIEEIFRKGHYINSASEKIKDIFNRMEKNKIPGEYATRNFHKEVIKLSKAYFLVGDYFQAVKISCIGYNKRSKT
jgi:hypothetical protein